MILVSRGTVISHEIIREWNLRFGRSYAKPPKRRQPQLGDKSFPDKVFVRIRCELHRLWRAVNQHGSMLGALVQSRCNTKAAKR
jgi:putative transposase